MMVAYCVLRFAYRASRRAQIEGLPARFGIRNTN